MNANETAVQVFAGWLDGEPLIGTLYASTLKKESYSFEFSDAWLERYSHIVLDPDLYNGRGRQYVGEKKIFGIFSDCAPDRWGRTLMKRREEILAHEARRDRRTLREIDFILGVDDETRMGGLRFKYAGKDAFAAVDEKMKVPPMKTLRTLESASLALEHAQDPYERKWLEMLLRPGSSLGGARPKATVKDERGTLWVAKFPSKNDEHNVGAWEKTTSDLARLCGLNIPRTDMKVFDRGKATFLVERFDRIHTEKGYERLHYASAMTMLGKTDGNSGADGTSYYDIADFIKTNSTQPKDDLKELWKRVVFNVLVSNTDDHLRNHGFLLEKKGWRLSPAFDINPNPDGNTLSLNISRDDSTKDLALAIETAKYYDIPAQEANETARFFRETVEKNWRNSAKNNGLDTAEIERMSPAFL